MMVVPFLFTITMAVYMKSSNHHTQAPLLKSHNIFMNICVKNGASIHYHNCLANTQDFIYFHHDWINRHVTVLQLKTMCKNHHAQQLPSTNQYKISGTCDSAFRTLCAIYVVGFDMS